MGDYYLSNAEEIIIINNIFTRKKKDAQNTVFVSLPVISIDALVSYSAVFCQ